MNEDLKRLIAITDAASIGETDICLDTDGWAEIHAHLVELEERRKVRHPEEIQQKLDRRFAAIVRMRSHKDVQATEHEIHILEWVLSVKKKVDK